MKIGRKGVIGKITIIGRKIKKGVIIRTVVRVGIRGKQFW